MKTHTHLWERLCSWENLVLAYENAKRHKTANPKIKEFSARWAYNLAMLKHELRSKTYTPRPLKKFVLRDPKTRIISVSDFRDRVVHHALINILQPIFEPRFIYGSYASRKGKGVLSAIKRFEQFQRRITKNGTRITAQGSQSICKERESTRSSVAMCSKQTSTITSRVLTGKFFLTSSVGV